MRTDELLILTSGIHAADAMRAALKNLERTRAVQRIDKGPDYCWSIVRPEPCALTHFEFRANAEVSVSRRSTNGPWVDSILAFAERHKAAIPNTLTRFDHGSGLDPRHGEVDCELSVTVGLRAGIPSAAVVLGNLSPAINDLQLRRHLFDRFLGCLKIGNVIRTEWRDERLFLQNDASDRFRVWHSAGHPDGGNPYGCEVRGLASLADAWLAARRALGDVCGDHSIDEVSYFGKMAKLDYDAMRRTFLELGHGWECEFLAAPKRTLDEMIASHKRPSGTTDRIPAFEWEEPRRDLFFQADLILEPDGLAWEITTNCTDVEYALKRAREVVGLPFEAVE